MKELDELIELSEVAMAYNRHLINTLKTIKNKLENEYEPKKQD